MEYIQLKKLFHINENECHQLYERRFFGESTNRLGIKLKSGYECFYVLNDEILSLIDKVYTINTWIEKVMASDILPNSAKSYLFVKSLVEEIKSSNQMEGIYSTRKELKNMFIEPSSQKYKRFYGMVNKYRKLQDEPFSSIHSVIDIRKLYDEILLEDIIREDENDKPDGVVFRKGPVEVRGSTKVIHKGVNDESHIIDMMEKSLNILNNDQVHFLIRIIIFHYLFEYIHPFYNGNGRMGRFIASGYLSNHFNILSAFQLSIACLHNQKKYYDSFVSTNDIRNKGDLTVFIIYFLEIYVSGLEELKEQIENTIENYEYMRKKICLHIDSKYQTFVELILQVTLFGVEGFFMSQMVKITGYTEQSIRTIIKKVNKEYTIIKIDKTHKPYKYSIDLDVVSIME